MNNIRRKRSKGRRDGVTIQFDILEALNILGEPSTASRLRSITNLNGINLTAKINDMSSLDLVHLHNDGTISITTKGYEALSFYNKALSGMGKSHGVITFD